MTDWILTLGGMLAMAILCVVANHRAGLPWNDEKPRIVPWRLVLIFSGFALVVLLIHLVNLAGLETGPDKSPFGRF